MIRQPQGVSLSLEFDDIAEASYEHHGSILSICSFPGCTTLTMGGGTCVAHDVPVHVVFPRGRPYVTARENRFVVAE